MKTGHGVVRGVIAAMCLALAAAVLPAQAQESPMELEQLLQETSELLADGRAEQAWQQLAPREFEFAGQTRFDYQLGLAALDSGRPTRATLAFERVIAMRPNHAGARMGMARAYYALRDYERARVEFETLRGMNPPDPALVAIERYLDAIDERTLPPVRTRWSAHAALTSGYDTNVNNSTDRETVTVPALGNAEFTLNPDNLATEDGYIRVGAGGEVNHALRDNLGLFAGVDLVNRSNFEESDFDTLRGDVRAGARVRSEHHFYRLGFSWSELRLDGESNRRTTGVNGEWRWLLSNRNQVAMFAQGNRLRYPEGLDHQDADQVLGGVSWLHNLTADGRTRLSGTLLGGVENEQGGRPDGDKSIAGVRLGVQYLLQADVLMVLDAGYQQDRFSEENPAFQVEREDEPADVSLSLDWRPGVKWSVQPRLSYTDYQSNIPINEFDRVDFSVTLQREFR